MNRLRVARSFTGQYSKEDRVYFHKVFCSHQSISWFQLHLSSGCNLTPTTGCAIWLFVEATSYNLPVWPCDKPGSGSLLMRSQCDQTDPLLRPQVKRHWTPPFEISLPSTQLLNIHVFIENDSGKLLFNVCRKAILSWMAFCCCKFPFTAIFKTRFISSTSQQQSTRADYRHLHRTWLCLVDSVGGNNITSPISIIILNEK